MVDVKNLDEQPAEVRAAIESWKQAKPELDVMRREQEVEQAKTAADKHATLASLEGRHRETHNVVLFDGITFPVKISLTVKEQAKFEALQKKLNTLGLEGGHDEEMSTTVLEMVSTISAEGISLVEHPDRFSNEDITQILLEFAEKRKDYYARIRNFREKRLGTPLLSNTGKGE